MKKDLNARTVGRIIDVVKSLVLLALIIWAMLVVADRISLVSQAPVVFKARTGEVCGCITVTNHEYPTLEACEDVDWDGLYEVIPVSRCQ